MTSLALNIINNYFTCLSGIITISWANDITSTAALSALSEGDARGFFAMVTPAIDSFLQIEIRIFLITLLRLIGLQANFLASLVGELIDARPHIIRLNSSPVNPRAFSASNVILPTL